MCNIRNAVMISHVAHHLAEGAMEEEANGQTCSIRSKPEQEEIVSKRNVINIHRFPRRYPVHDGLHILLNISLGSGIANRRKSQGES